MSVDLSKLEVDKTVDARGAACPGPLLDAKRAMPGVAMGGVLEVLTSEKGTTEDIPLWSKKVGHEHLGDVEEAGFWRVFVRRGK